MKLKLSHTPDINTLHLNIRLDFTKNKNQIDQLDRAKKKFICSIFPKWKRKKNINRIKQWKIQSNRLDATRKNIQLFNLSKSWKKWFEILRMIRNFVYTFVVRVVNVILLRVFTMWGLLKICLKYCSTAILFHALCLQLLSFNFYNSLTTIAITHIHGYHSIQCSQWWCMCVRRNLASIGSIHNYCPCTYAHLYIVT